MASTVRGIMIFIFLGVLVAPLVRAESNSPLVLPPPPKFSAPKVQAVPPAAADQPASPNQALADLAKEAVLKSLKPEYDKQENWGHQKEIVDGYHWEQRADGWHLAQQKKKVNEGTWRSYRVRLDNPEKNLRLRFTPPQAAPNGGTAFQAFLTARMWAEGIQEQWVLGVKGLNFHVEGYATIQARLDIVVHVQPVPGAGFGTIEVLPNVTGVDLELTDLTLTKVDALHGDAARRTGADAKRHRGRRGAKAGTGSGREDQCAD